MHTPEKQRFLALKESLQTMDCEILVTLQGFADTYDEDGDMDDDMIAVGTTSPTETLQSLIQQVAAEEIVARKLDTPRTLRLWMPRNKVFNGYKSKDRITKMLRMQDFDGYDKKQIYAYITTNPNGPSFEQAAEEEVSGGERQRAEREDDNGSQPSGFDTASEQQGTPPATPQKEDPKKSPTASQSSKRKRLTTGPPEDEDMDMDEDYLPDEELEAALRNAELTKQTKNTGEETKQEEDQDDNL